MEEIRQKHRILSKDLIMISMKIPSSMHAWLKINKYNMTAVFEQKCKELGWNGQISIKQTK